MRQETIEHQIDMFVKDKYKKTKEEVALMTIGNKMSLVGMKSQEKWDEFKMGLRKAGYII